MILLGDQLGHPLPVTHAREDEAVSCLPPVDLLRRLGHALYGALTGLGVAGVVWSGLVIYLIFSILFKSLIYLIKSINLI